MCGHICYWADANNMKCVYSSVPCHIVECSEFISNIYIDIAVSHVHDLHILHLSDTFVAGTYITITFEVDIAVPCVLAHICKNVGSVCLSNVISV